MPFVQLEGFAVEIDHYDNKEVSKVNIFVTYIIPRISRKKIGLKVTMYSGG